MNAQPLDPVREPGAPSDLARRARARRERLHGAMDRLESALAGPAAGRFDAWRAGVCQATRELVESIADHTAETEADDGILRRIVEEAPRLANQVERLRAQHSGLAAMCAALDDQAATASAGDVQDLREAGVEVLAELARHRQAGSDLLYEAYMLDVGTGD